MFDADWHGLGVHVRWRAPGEAGAKGGVEVRLALQAVVNPVRLSSQRRRGKYGVMGNAAFRLI